MKHSRNVFEWILGDGDDVGGFADFYGADLVTRTNQIGGVDGGGDEAVDWGHAGLVHVDELLGVCAVGSYADIGAEGDFYARSICPPE